MFPDRKSCPSSGGAWALTSRATQLGGDSQNREDVKAFADPDAGDYQIEPTSPGDTGAYSFELSSHE